MSKAYAKTRAEEKKKSSSASSQQSSYEKSVQIYNQQKELDVQAAKRAAENFTRAGNNTQYAANLEAYKARLQALGQYGYDVKKNVNEIDKEIVKVRPLVAQEAQTMQALQRRHERARAQKSTPWAERVGLVDPNEAEMTFGKAYNPTPQERGRLSNAIAAGGRGWLAGQQNALGFALDPDAPDEAEMFFGKAPTTKLGEKISGKINQGLLNVSQRLYGAADIENAASQAHLDAAKKGLGKVGQTLVDVGVAGTQMALDAGIGAATGTGMASMGTRTFGQSAREALDSGATYQQAMDYGMGSAAVELGTEKMFDVVKIFGGGVLDKAIEKWIVKYAKTPAGMTILRTIAGASGEGLEEIISSAVNPLLRSGYDPNALQDYKTADYWTDMLHEGLVGALLGGIGVAGNVITGGNARMVNEVNQEALNQRLQRADAFNEAQRKLFAGNTMQVGTADAEAARVLNRNSGTQGARDRAAVRTAAREQYGEQAKAVESVFEAGTADAETFQRQFQTAYDLGKEGAALDVVMNTPATADLNELQRENAWLIGRDAGIREGTIKEEANENGEAVRVRGSGERNPVQNPAGQVQQVEGDAGPYQEGRSLGVGRNAKDSAAADLRYSEEVKSARDLGIENGAVIKNLRTVDESSYTPEMREYAQEQAANGHKVTFVSGLIHAQDGPGGMITRARGMVNGNGDVIIQADNERFTALQIGRHEDGHLRIARGEIDLAATKEAVRESMGQERFDRAMQDYAEAYAGLDMTADEIWEEIVCDAQGEMNIFEGTLMRGAEQRASDLIRETKAQTTAGEQTQERAPPEEGSRKFSYAGVGAENADREALAQAQERERKGEDLEQIRRETGWFRGADGKWRFEISDREAQIDTIGDLIFRRDNAEYDEYRRLTDKFIKSTLTSAEEKRLRELDKKWKDDVRVFSERVTNGQSRLEHILKHDVLFEAYPFLRRVSVAFIKTDSFNGEFRPQENRIYLNSKLRDNPEAALGTLLHEMQHVIQHYEGFSEGTSPQHWISEMLQSGVHYTSEKAVELAQRYEDAVNAASADTKNILRKFDEAWAMNDIGAVDELVEQVEAKPKDNEIHDVMKLQFELSEARRVERVNRARHYYFGTAGEIEAQDTANRRRLTDEQRRQTPPDTGKDRSLLMFPEKKYKFSMETPIEETDRLIAWHNMGVDALNGALELGGLAMPSWAIQPANKAHTQYGDVSVIAPRDLVDPKRNRNSMIFGGDAWTPVFPEVNYKVSYEAAEALEDEIRSLVGDDVFRQIGGAALDKGNIADQFKRSNGRLSGHYARNLLLQYAYLKSTGIDIEAPTKEDDLYYGGDFTNEDVRRFVGKLANGKRTLEKLENMSVDELFEQDDLLQAIADVRYESYREKMGAKDKILAVMEKEGFFSKEKVKYTTIDRMLKAARKYLDGGVQQTVDKKALQEIIDREVDQSAYEAWILQKLNGTVERKGIRNEKDLFTPSGNRRSFDQLNYAYTLANIVKAMKAQPKQGRAQFLSGPGSVRGAAMKTYKDIEQVRSESGRVINPENYSEAPFNEYNENLSDILDRMTKNGDKFDAADAVIEILQHAKTEQGIYNYMQRELKDWYNVSPELAHDIYELIGQVNALPIPYFEGKTYDAVRLDEALAIVVPDTINADLKQRLEDAGANVLEYKAKDDADRLRVVNSVEGAKFSRETDLDRLARENSKLRREAAELQDEVKEWKAEARTARSEANKNAKDAAKWKRETTLTDGVRLRENDLKKAAKALLTRQGSEADVADLAGDLKALGEYILNGDEDGAMRWGIAEEMATDAAAKIVKNAVEVDERDPEYLSYLLTHTNGKPVHVDKKLGADIAYEMGCENITEFNKKYGRWMRLTYKESAADIEQIYQQTIDGDALTQDQMVREIIDTISALQPEITQAFQQYDADYDAAVSSVALQVLDAVMDESIRQMPPTFADKALAKREAAVQKAVEQERAKADKRVESAKASGEAKLQKQASRFEERLRRVKEQGERDVERAKYEYAFRANAAMRKLIDRHEKQVADLKEKHLQKERRDRERREEREGISKYRARVEKKAKQLGDWLLKNSAKEHIPENLKKPVAEFLATIDFTSKRQLGGGAETQKDKVFAERLRALKNALEKMQSGGAEDSLDSIRQHEGLPPYYMEFLKMLSDKAVTAMENGDVYTINQMTAAELKTLDETITAIVKTIRMMNRLYENGRAANPQALGFETIEEMDKLGAKKARGERGNAVRSFFAWDNTNPFYAFKRLGSAAASVFEEIQNGWDRFAFNVIKIMDFTKEAYTSKEVRDWGSEVHEFTLESGDKIYMTTAQIMSLRMLLLREQAVQHIQGGGVRIDDIDAKGKGNKHLQAEHYHLTAKDIETITGTLTERQREVANALQKFMQEQGGEWGNHVSRARWDIDFFGEENYFPIVTEDSDRNAIDPEARANDLFRLLNMGATKSLNPNANNALVIRDIFDVFADHMTDMAKYDGLALPILDAMKWLNYRFREETSYDAETGKSEYRSHTVQRAIEKAYGKEALRYLTTFMRDLNGVNESTGRGEGFARKMISNYKVAAVAANLRVALLQPTSYFRALYSINGRYLARALFAKPAVKECEKYSGIAAWKSLGYYDTNIARGVREQIKDSGGVKDKIQEASMKGAEWGDKLTWGALWNACKFAVKNEQPGLDHEALMRETAKKFREVVYSTQVVDSTMTRSHNMRGKSIYGSMATAFMAEPTLSYNIVMDAVSEFQNEARRTNRQEAWKKSRGKVAKAFTVYCLSGLAASIAESLMDAFRDDDEYEEFYQKFLEAMFGEKGLKGRLNGNLANDLLIFNKLPLIKDALSLLSGYSTDRIDMEWMSNAIKAFGAIKEKIELATGKLEQPTKTTYYGNMTWYGAVYLGLKTLSQATGLPVGSATREVVTLWNNTVGDMTGQKIVTYDSKPEKQIQKGFENGWLTEENAIRLLVDEGAAKDEDDAWFKVQKWSTGEGKFDAAVDAMLNGNKKAFSTAVTNLTAHGVKQKSVDSSMKSAIKKLYVGTEEEPASISADRAKKLLQDYAGMKADEAAETVTGWKAKLDTGYELGEIRESYLDGEISRQQVVTMRVKYAGDTQEDAEKYALRLDCEKKYGVSYGEESVIDAVVNGEISVDTAAKIWSEYGGIEGNDLENRITKLQFTVDHPGTSYEDVSVKAVKGYNDYGKAAHISAEDYMSYYAQMDTYSSDYDANGKTIKGQSKMDKVFAYIAGLGVSPEQKTALALSMYAQSTVAKNKTW